jgi:hypothetical protein
VKGRTMPANRYDLIFSIAITVAIGFLVGRTILFG